MSTSNDRDQTVDLLRFIAIVCIVVAHATPNNIFFQIRNFDVVLMVFLNGISFYISQNNKKIKYKSYITKRFNRLIMSTWIFLFLFFLLFFIISFVLRTNYYFSIKTILASFSLISGIGYVWIMYVFFVVALISPFILVLSQKITNHLYYFAILGVAYVSYEVLISINTLLPSTLKHISEMYIFNPIGYCIVAAVGIRFKKLSKKDIWKGNILFFLIFISLFYLNNFESTQNFKYPPKIYYLSYGLFASFTLYLLLIYSQLLKKLFNQFIFFFSRTSLNLYFFHIIALYLLEIYGGEFSIIPNYFFTRFLFIMGIAMFLTYLNEKIKNGWNKTIIKRNILKDSNAVDL